MERPDPEMADRSPRCRLLHWRMGRSALLLDTLQQNTYLAVACVCGWVGCATVVSSQSLRALDCPRA